MTAGTLDRGEPVVVIQGCSSRIQKLQTFSNSKHTEGVQVSVACVLVYIVCNIVCVTLKA